MIMGHKRRNGLELLRQYPPCIIKAHKAHEAHKSKATIKLDAFVFDMSIMFQKIVCVSIICIEYAE